MCTEVCQWLLRVAQGVVVNALAQYDETILHIAGRMDHWEVIDMMQNPFGRALVVPGPKLADFGGIAPLFGRWVEGVTVRRMALKCFRNFLF